MSDKFFEKTHCDRCGKILDAGRIMSIFNTDCICMECKDKERKRTDYKTAADAEIDAVKRGEYNFKGIGYLPEKDVK